MSEKNTQLKSGSDNGKSETDLTSRKQCELIHCRYPREGASQLCIFHMSEEEKTKLKLWKKCIEKFTDIVGKEGKSYKGFILKNVTLSGRTFDYVIDFTDTIFVGTSDFSMVHFQDVATFKGATFSSSANFEESVFKKEAVFTGSLFNENVNFRDSRFDGKTYFKRIHFREANFHNTVFGAKCIFSPKDDELIKGIPTFTVADFTGVHFEKGGSFDHCIIGRGNFEDSSIQNVSFRDVNLDEARFAGSQMEFAYLSDSEWTVDLDRPQYTSLLDWFNVYDARLVIREELEARDIDPTHTREKISAYKTAEGTYRRIKHSLANEGHYEKAGEFYIHEMRMKKERYSHDQGLNAKWNYFWNVLYSWTTGYGERPKRVFLNAFLIILIFALLYAAFDGITKAGEDDKENYDPDFRECLYFSVVTFTTLGYGDYAPKASFQLVAVLEAFLGAFTIALFVLVFGRKVMR